MMKYLFNVFILFVIVVKNVVLNCLFEGLCGLFIIKNDGCILLIFVKMVFKLNVKFDFVFINVILWFICVVYVWYIKKLGFSVNVGFFGMISINFWINLLELFFVIICLGNNL